jgi:molecular chaperone HscB
MSSPTTTRSLQACRNCGGGAPIDVHFCPQCSQILSLGRHGDYFAFLGIPRTLTIDAPDLEQRFRTLSRQFHPDYFYNATPAERRASLERSSYLNDAYRTLRHPISRVEYLLGLEGFSPRTPEEASKQVPPDLLEEVFALNEELDAIRELRESGAPPDVWKSRLERARGPIEAKREAHEREVAELADRWDALIARGAARDEERRPILEALRERVLERTYITNLLAGIERELNESGSGLEASGSGQGQSQEPKA